MATPSNVGRAANGRFTVKGSADDTTIVMDLDASGVTAGAAQVEAAMVKVGRAVTTAATTAETGTRKLKKVGDAIADVGVKGPKAASALTPIAEAFQQINRVSQASSGSLAAIGESLGALARGAGGAHGKLLLMATGATALVGVLATVAVGVYSTAASIDELSASLSDSDRRRLAPYISKLEATRDATDEAADAFTRLRIVLASDLAPAATTGARAVGAVADDIERLHTMGAEAFLSVTELGRGLQTLAAIALPKNSMLRLLLPGLDAAVADSSLSPLLTDAEIKQRDGEVPAALAPSTAPAAPKRRPSVAGRAAPVTAPNRDAEDNAALDALFSDVAQSQLKQEADARAAIERDEIAKRQAAFQSYYDWQKRAAGEASAADIAATQAAAEAAARAAAERQQIEQTMYGVIGQLSSGLLGLVQQNIANEVATTAEARAEQFRQQQKASEAQALVAGALAIVQGFAQLGPVAGAIAAIGTAAATGLQIAAIENQAPPDVYHVGGALAPDEVAITRQNERLGVFTAQAADALGEQGLRDVTQSGRSSAPVVNVWVVDDKGTRRAREFARPDHTIGQRGA